MGSYLIGHAFSTNPDVNGVVFCGQTEQKSIVDNPEKDVNEGIMNTDQEETCPQEQGLDYTQSRDRLFRWLDYRHRFGSRAITSKSLGVLASLAILAPDKSILLLARMVFYMQLFQTLLEQESITSQLWKK